MSDLDFPKCQESAIDFMLRKAYDFVEWLTIGDPRTMVRIRECIRRYPKYEVRAALIETCMSNAGAHGRRSRTVERRGWRKGGVTCLDGQRLLD